MTSAEVTRDLLSLHETVSTFDGKQEQPCFFMTALCPDECNHGGTVAIFTVTKYLKYEKPGQYGDAKSDKHYVKLSDGESTTGLTADRKSVLESLSKGDHVLLSWDHVYVHNGGCHYPERPITKLTKISPEEANKY